MLNLSMFINKFLEGLMMFINKFLEGLMMSYGCGNE